MQSSCGAYIDQSIFSGKVNMVLHLPVQLRLQLWACRRRTLCHCCWLQRRSPQTHMRLHTTTTHDTTNWHMLHAAQAAANGQCSCKMGISAKVGLRHSNNLKVVVVRVHEHITQPHEHITQPREHNSRATHCYSMQLFMIRSKTQCSRLVCKITQHHSL